MTLKHSTKEVPPKTYIDEAKAEKRQADLNAIIAANEYEGGDYDFEDKTGLFEIS
jgi:hypothetical protein